MAAVAAAAPSDAPVQTSGTGAATAVIAVLLVASLLLLLAAVVPLRFLPARVGLTIADRRSDLATAGAMGVVALALAYLISHA